MEPCTLRGKSLLEERKECAFSEPQVRACMGQHPGALGSKRALQPPPTAGLEVEAAFQSGIQMANASWLPFDGVAFTRDTMLAASWSVQSRTSLRKQKRTLTQILQEIERRLQHLQERSKMRAFPHQRYLVDINIALVFASMRLIEWRGRLWWTILTASAVSGLVVVEPEKAREGVVHADTTEARRQCHPIWLVPHTEAQRQRQRDMRIALLNMKKGCNCTLHPRMQCTASWRSHWPKVQATSGQRRSTERSSAWRRGSFVHAE